MSRSSLLLAGLAALLFSCGLLLYTYRQAPEPEVPPVKISKPVDTVSVEPAPPQQPRLLEIRGRVLGENLQPRVGLTVVCGEQAAETDLQGTFSFPAARRPRSVRVAIQSAGKELVSWGSVLTGDSVPSGEDTSEEVTTVDSNGWIKVVNGLERTLLPAEPERLDWTINLGRLLPDGENASLEASEWIRMERFFVEQWGKGGRVRVFGRTRLPEGAHVATSLYFDEFRLIASLEPAEVQAGSFEAVMMVPLDAKLYAGTYTAIASFSSAFESFDMLKAWSQERPEVKWSNLVIPQVETPVSIGDPAEALADDRATQEYYRSRLDSVAKFHGELETRVKSLRKAAKNPEAEFDEESWRKFLDEEWRPPLKSLLDAHVNRGAQKYLDARGRMDMIFKTLYSMSYAYSRFVVYEKFNRKAHPNDFYMDEGGQLDLVRMKRTYRDHFKKMQRFRFLVPAADSGTNGES